VLFMNEIKKYKNNLFILYYTATPNGEDKTFVHQYLKREEGIPIGNLFFWIRGAWEYELGSVYFDSLELYEELMGVVAMDHREDEIIGPFQNIEEVRRFSYLLCQKLNCECTSLISVDDFNRCVSESSNKHEVLTKVNQISDSLDNLDADKSRGFFDRILSRG